MKRFFILTVMMVFSMPSFSFSETSIKGKYELLGSIEKLKGAKSLEMMEFFNYSCGHCYSFLETSGRLHKKYKDKLHHIKYPIYWGEQTPYPSKAFYITDQLGLEKKFTQELFDTNFKLSINIFQTKVIHFLAQDLGIEKEMKRGMLSKQIDAKVKRGLELAKQYKANETPTLIINKVLKVTPSISGGDVNKMTDNLEIIFDDILKSN